MIALNDEARDWVLKRIREAMNVPHDHSLMLTSLSVRNYMFGYRIAAYVKFGGFEGVKVDKPWIHIAFDTAGTDFPDGTGHE